MVKTSRTSRATKNVTTSVISKMLTLCLSFLLRKCFIDTLGLEYVGVQSVFANVLQVLSFAELGVGTAITYALYRPISEHNEIKINQLMRLFQRIYTLVGAFILVSGISLLPLLDYFFKDKVMVDKLALIFLLYIANSSVSYFFSYRATLLVASQQEYLVTVRSFIMSVLCAVAQVIILLLTHSFLLFLTAQLAATVIRNIWIFRVSKNKYPCTGIDAEERLPADEMVQIKKNVSAMMIHKLATVMVNGTDSLIIARFVGLITAGLYANYLMLVHTLTNIQTTIFMTVQASVGNYYVTEDSDKQRNLFYLMYHADFLCTSFIAICLACLSNVFIQLFFGKELVLPVSIAIMIGINYYFKNMRLAFHVFRDAMGLYRPDRWKAILETVINIVVSIVLSLKMGLFGVLLGTLISNITTCFWVEPLILFKYGFHSSGKKYVKRTIWYMISFTLTWLAAQWVSNLYSARIGIVGFLIQCMICAFVTFVLLIIFGLCCEEQKGLWSVLKRIAGSKDRRPS